MAVYEKTRSVGALVVGLILMALSAVAQTVPFDDRFQRELDRHGIDYQIPRTGKAILVNIPAFELVAFENGVPVLRSRVIVGTPWNQTPILDTVTTAVRFRPTWRPTPSMIASGEHVDRIWPPGESNPLGLAAIRLEEGLLIYLHDTNRRELFAEPDRALSHGCIRVEMWDKLSAWVLDVPVEVVHITANGERTIDAETPPIPVNLRYLRRFIDADGQVLTYPDIYQREVAALKIATGC